MPEGVIAGILVKYFAYFFVLLVFTVICAVILRAAVALYNKLAGGASSPSSVPEPAFGKAMGSALSPCW